MNPSLAQEEADRYFSNPDHLRSHPEDLEEEAYHSDDSYTKDTTKEEFPEEDDADGSDDDILHDYNNGKMGTSTATYQLPTTLFDANTGPKGVIADAASFERAKKKSFRRTLINLTSAAYPFSSSKNQKDSTSGSPDNSASDPENEEEEFMRQWRENRLRELQAGTAGQRKASPSKRRYGSLDEVDANGYLDAVEKIPYDTVVVVCIFDPESLASATVERSLSTLARRNATTRFIKLHYAIAEMDHVGVPAILAYKAGEVFATIMDIKDDQREADDLEKVLMANRVI